MCARQAVVTYPPHPTIFRFLAPRAHASAAEISISRRMTVGVVRWRLAWLESGRLVVGALRCAPRLAARAFVMTDEGRWKISP